MPSKNIPIRLKHSDGNKISPASGAIFPKTPQGEIFCSFFVDHHTIPVQSELRMNHYNKTAYDHIEPHDEITREVLVSIIMSPQTAKVIGEQLIMLSKS